MVRQGNLINTRALIAVVRTFIIGGALLVVVGCAGVRSEAPKAEEQGHTEATKQEQRRSPEPTASEDPRCEGTRTIDLLKSSSVSSVTDSSVQPGDPEARYTTNDVPGCPTGGLLSGTDKQDRLAGEDGEDEVRGLGGSDHLSGGRGSDVVYGGSGGDELQAGGLQLISFYTDTSKNALHGGPGRDFLAGAEGDDVLYGGEDVLYGGDGNDWLDDSGDGHRDKLYCGEGRDEYLADKIDYVDGSCEV